ncbi:MAG: hypothetical protein FJ126_00035 [Deltaproteobacteria bacterium]|nr:hypothetical protein [Deltaproteobacteria bacterium]
MLRQFSVNNLTLRLLASLWGGLLCLSLLWPSTLHAGDTSGYGGKRQNTSSSSKKYVSKNRG